MKKFFVLLCLTCSMANAQTFNGTGGLIPDDGTSTIEFSINVSGLPTSTGSGFGITQSCIDVSHTWNADLEISLIAPDGTMSILTSGNGGDSDDYDGTCFNQSAGTSIFSGWGPFNGSYTPQQSLGYFNAGMNPNGIWKLRIYDNYPADQGTLNNWSITFGSPAPTVTPFTSSDLPIVVINTNSQNIVDDPKILADMGIIYNGPGIRNYMTDPFNHYNGKIGIEIRGSSSAYMFPKKSYGFETTDSLLNEIDVSFFGMPVESDWILSANYTDKSFQNNVLAYKLFSEMGHYAPRTQYVEVVLNNQYAGVYVLMEKIKRDAGRVNVSKLTPDDTTGVDLTGGYIIKIDKSTGSGGDGFTSLYTPNNASGSQTIFYQYEYPSEVNIVPQQKNYIQNFTNSFENALMNINLYDTINGWRHYADELSFIHYFILNELSRNVDGYRLSTYLYKTKSTVDDKLHIGPPWDYDIAWANANYCNGSDVTGWAYDFNYVCNGDYWLVPFWWNKLMTDSLFVNRLNCAYQYLRTTTLDTAYLFQYIDSTASYINEGQQRNFDLYPILGNYVWPNPAPFPTDFAGETDELKNWISNRLQWMDANMPGNCSTIGIDENLLSTNIRIWPNPFTNELNLLIPAVEEDTYMMSLVSMDGKTVYSKQIDVIKNGSPISISDQRMNELAKGIYHLRLTNSTSGKVFKLVKE